MSIQKKHLDPNFAMVRKLAQETARNLGQEHHEIWPGPDESDCPMSPIAGQLQRQSRSLDELGKALDSLVVRLQVVLNEKDRGIAGCEREEPKFSSELALAISHDVDRIDEMHERVVQILHRLEI